MKWVRQLFSCKHRHLAFQNEDYHDGNEWQQSYQIFCPSCGKIFLDSPSEEAAARQWLEMEAGHVRLD